MKTTPNTSNALKETLATKIFWSFVIVHVLLWSILPELARYTPSYDIIEAVNWAQQLDWGYDKNPWVIGWLTRLGIDIALGKSFLGYYFLQQLLVALGFWSIWQLGKQLFRPAYALIAVLILEGCTFFSTAVQTNNDNFALIGFLAFTMYAFFMALKNKGNIYSLLAGGSLGLAVMSKYSAIIILPWIWLCFFLEKWNTQTDKNKKTQSLKDNMLMFKELCFTYFKRHQNKNSNWSWYGGVFLFLLLCLPNLVWLIDHDFVTIRYLLVRQNITNTAVWMKHLYYSLDFIWRIFLGILPGFLLLLLFVNFKGKTSSSLQRTQMTHQSTATRQFLFCTGLAPLATIVLLSLLFGWQLYWEWGVPFIPLLGLVLFTYWQPVLTKKKLQIFIIGIFTLMVLFSSGYYLIETRFKAGVGSADYPATEIANTVTQIWREKFHTPLRYVAGSRYVAGFVAFYAKDNPKIFIEWNPLYSPKIDLQDMKKHGAIFVNDGYFGTKVLPRAEDFAIADHFPAEVLKAYPTLEILPIKIFPYHRNQKTHETVKLLIGILPPEK